MFLLLIHTLCLSPLYLFHACPKCRKFVQGDPIKLGTCRPLLPTYFFAAFLLGPMYNWPTLWPLVFTWLWQTEQMQFIKRMVSLSVALSRKAFQTWFTKFGLAAQPVTLLQIGKLQMVSSLSQENKGYQLERFSTQANFCKKNIFGIQRGAFEILISTFLAGLESGQKLMR